MIAGGLRHALRHTPIGQNDLHIAATALANGCGVVTANVREFTRVPGLAVEDWTAAWRDAGSAYPTSLGAPA